MQMTASRRALAGLAILAVVAVGLHVLLFRQNGSEARTSAHEVSSAAKDSSDANAAEGLKTRDTAALFDSHETTAPISAYQKAKQEYEAAASYKVLVHQALANPTPEKLRFAILAIETCELIAETKRYPQYEARLDKLRVDLKTPWLDRERRCGAGGGIEAHQTYAVRQRLKTRQAELPLAAYQHQRDGDKAQLLRVNALRDVDLAINWGFAAPMHSPELLRLNDQSVGDAHQISISHAWMLAVCERYQCAAPERSADACLRVGLCSQPDFAAQIEALQLHPESRVQTTPEQWRALREGMRQKVAELLWEEPR